jgi:hypothetical protein
VNDIDLDSVLYAKIDTGRMLAQDYKGSERDLCVYLVQQYYQEWLRIGLEKGDNVKKDSWQLTALDKSKVMAIQRLTTELHDLVDRATLFALDEATREQWFRRTFEWDTIEEMLANLVDGEDTDAVYDYKYILETIYPLIKLHGGEPSDMLAAKNQVRKFRAIVSPHREAERRLKAKEITEDQYAETTRWLLGTAADTKITIAEQKQMLDKWRGVIREVNKIEGFTFILPGNERWVVMKPKDDVEARALEMAMKGIAEITHESLDVLLDAVTKMIKGRANE